MYCDIILMTLNAAELTNPIKRHRMARFIIKKQIKAVCFQETHLWEIEAKYLRETFQGSICHAATASRSKGWWLVFLQVYLGNRESLLDKEGRYIILKGTLKQVRLILVEHMPQMGISCFGKKFTLRSVKKRMSCLYLVVSVQLWIPIWIDLRLPGHLVCLPSFMNIWKIWRLGMCGVINTGRNNIIPFLLLMIRWDSLE